MGFWLEVDLTGQLSLWPSECILPPLSSPAAGSSEPVGDGSRGRALHEHPGEVCPSLLPQVRSNSPLGHCFSHGSSVPPNKPCGFSGAS